MKDVSDMASRFADDPTPSDDKTKGAKTPDDQASETSTEPKPESKAKTEAKSEAKSKTGSTPDQKTPPPKTRRRKPSPSKKATAASVQAELDALEARLKHAEDVTKRSIGSLETVVSALEANLNKSSAQQKGRLTRHVNELTERLDRQTTQMRSAVRAELRSALAEGGMDNVEGALGRASSRLDRAEVAQADAIARVNKHLADMARAVDARMKAETQSRKAELDKLTQTLTGAIADSRTDLIERVETIERDSSAAFNTVGETIERLHEKLEARRKTSNETVIEKINELAVQTKADIESRQSDLNTRFEEIEARTLAVGTGAAERAVEKARSDLDHKIDALKSRLAELEDKTTDALSSLSARPTVSEPEKPRPAPVKSAEEIGLAPLPPLPKIPSAGPSDNQASSNAPLRPARQTSGAASAAMASPADNPYAANLKTVEETQQNRPLTPPAPVLPFPGQPPASARAVTADAGTPPPLPPFQMPSSPTPPPMAGTQSSSEPFQTAPVPGAVYSDPAYAEHNGSPKAVRVTEDAPKRGLSLPSISGRNLRVAALAVSVAVVGLMAGRMILGGSDITDPNVTGGGEGQSVVMTEPLTGSLPLTGVGPDTMPTNSAFGPNSAGSSDPNSQTVVIDPNTATTPIGNYAEQQPVILDTAQLDTLDAAVEAGNPIAQFQKGLAELDAGRTDEGAALIRQAASSNQPAALYRLAKLYEAGEGVPRDDVMARQLIERAARGGHRIAMHDLALYYTEGRGGVALDMIAAKSWFEQAARRGVVDSQFNLAILSESTETGTDPDLDEALFWYSVAAEQGDQFAVSRRDALKETLNANRVNTVESRLEDFTPQAIDEEANGIFRDVPWVKSSDTANRTQVREVQTLLASLGYQVGTPDGIMGSQTRSAIVAFERANGLTETGEVNGTLINRLSRATGA